MTLSRSIADATANKKNWFAKHKIFTVILGIIVIVIIASASSGSKNTGTSTPAAPDKSSTSAGSTKASTPAPTPQVLLDLTGSGIKTTQKFTAAGDWDLNWSYDCSQVGGQGNCIVTVYNGDGTPSDNAGVNELGASGSDVEHFHTGGTMYLEVNSECSWHVTAKG